MSFVLNTVVESCDVVDIIVTKLLGNTEFLVIVKRNSIEIYSFDREDQLQLQNKFDLYEHLLDVRTITLFDSKKLLAVTTGSNKLLLIGFNSLTDAFILEEIILRDHEVYLTIQQGTLEVDPSNKYIVLHTNEGLLVTYDIDEKISKLDLKTYQAQKKKKKNLIRPPTVSSFPKHKRETKDPMLVEKLMIFNDREYSYISVLYRDDLFQYYLKTYSRENGKLDFWTKLRLLESIKPEIVIPVHEVGTFMMGKTGVILSIAPYWAKSSFLDAKNQASTIHIQNDEQQTFIQKKLPAGTEWEIKSATLIPTSDDYVKMLLATSQNDLYISSFKAERDTVTGELYVDSWTLQRLEGSYTAPSLLKTINNTTLIFKTSSSIEIKKFQQDFKKLSTVQTTSITPPIMDFNISGTTLPKVQVCGGSDLQNGFIKTEYLGYRTDSTKIGDLTDLEGITNIWRIENKLVINTLDGVHIYKHEYGKYHLSEDDFYGLNDVDGNVIDLNFLNGQLTTMTDKGIFINGKQIQDANITAGSATRNSVTAYVSGKNLHRKQEKYTVADDVSTIHAFQDHKTTRILVGHWDGSAEVFIDGIKKTLQKSNMTINSVLVKKVGSKVLYCIGDAEGNVKILNSEDTHMVNIGDAPVTIVDYKNNSILVYNAENLVRIELDENTGEVKQRGYLNIGVPSCLSYDIAKDELLAVVENQLYELKIEDSPKILTNDAKLSKLVRKSVKFKNFLHLSLFLINGTKINKNTGEEVWSCELHVIDNNNFQTKSIYKFKEGIEITDVVNSQYHKELIDTYEEENIGLAMENVLSQCFVVSCSYSSQDEYGPPLMLFSVDEFGQLQYQCSSPKIQTSFQSLTNHGNRIIIGVGDSILGFKVEYSITDSKFSLKKITDSFKTRYFTSHIKSCGPDVVVGDLIQGVSRLELKVKKNRVDEQDMIFQFEESSKELENVHFLTALESFGNIVITADSLRNIKINVLNNDQSLLISEFNLDDQINSIRVANKDQITLDKVNQVLLGGNLEDLDDIIPLFVLGSVTGGLYLLSIAIAEDLAVVLKDAQNSIIRSKHKVITNDTSPDGKLLEFEDFKNVKGTKQTMNRPYVGFVDGDLIKKYDDDLSGTLVSTKCVLL